MPELRAGLRDRARHRLGLVVDHAGDGLVEQQQLGLRAQRPGQLDALARAVGQRADRTLELAEAEQLGDLPHPRLVLGPLPPGARQPQPVG